MKITIRQVQGNSGADVWAENLCRGLHTAGYDCQVDLRSIIYQFCSMPGFMKDSFEHSDIIQSNSWNGYAFKEDCPLVVTEHHVVHDPAFTPYKTAGQKSFHQWIFHCEKKTFRSADAIVTVSEYTRNMTEKIFGLSDTQMIYNGIDTTFFKPVPVYREKWGIPDDVCILLNTGNLSLRKGADLLPVIMKELGDRFLLLTTSGNPFIPGTPIRNIRDIGYLRQEQLVDAYNLCDIFLTPTRLEGFGLSVAEAMACGKPVVATNCSSIPELIVNEKGGFLCGMDNVQEYADRIRYLADHPDEQVRMGVFNRQRINDLFTVEKMTNEYLDLYKAVMITR